jgi:hypothetical protein
MASALRKPCTASQTRLAFNVSKRPSCSAAACCFSLASCSSACNRSSRRTRSTLSWFQTCHRFLGRIFSGMIYPRVQVSTDMQCKQARSNVLIDKHKGDYSSSSSASPPLLILKYFSCNKPKTRDYGCEPVERALDTGTTRSRIIHNLDDKQNGQSNTTKRPEGTIEYSETR